MKHSNKKWIYGLDSIRFVLALIVLVGHSGFIPDYDLGQHPTVLAQAIKLVVGNAFVGIAAVIGFFVISGFVIHFPYRDGKPLNIYEFYSKRVLRIVIPLAIMFLMCAVLGQEVPFVVWSLYCEMIYYLFYPLLYRPILRNSRNIDALIIGSTALGLLAIWVNTNDFEILLRNEVNRTANFHTSNHLLNWVFGLPSWLMGVRLAVRFDELAANSISFNRLIATRLFVWLAAMVCSILRFHFAVSYKLTFLLFFSYLCYVWICNEIRYYQDHKPLNWLEYGGKWSYSIYLFHMIFVQLYIDFFSPDTVVSHLFKLITVLLSCYIMYLLVERPSHKLIKLIKIKSK